MDSSRLDLNLLATLEVLLVERNVTRAAARLNLSQPAVSAQLARLRDLFQDPLLIPAQRGMIPTARALALLPGLRLGLDHVRNTLQSHQDFDPETAQLTLSIAGSDYVQAAVVMPLVLALRRAAPGVRVAVWHLSPERMAQQLSSGEVDLAIATPDPMAPGLRTSALYTESYVLIGRRGHPRLQPNMSIEAYLELEHVVVSRRGGTFHTPIDDALSLLGHRRKVVMSAASFLFIPEIVASSDLVALVPRRLYRAQSDRLTGVELPWLAEQFEIGLIWHERAHGHPGHAWVRALIGTLI